ncbi:uncharacterized protein LOC120897385 [Anopheles arabiensis]|uniref:uncharacterized protein LOC120897385 n=1 Tax=Anopheles arabiensis TaxID=7173 RepID=UPI001AAE0602|nr:uncharacterized protein LOC120897385 [Anopheles arabiensis]
MNKSQTKLVAGTRTGAAVLTEQVDPLGKNTQDERKKPTAVGSITRAVASNSNDKGQYTDAMKLDPSRIEIESVLANAIKIENFTEEDSVFNEESISLDTIRLPKRKYFGDEESEDDSSITSKSQDSNDAWDEMHYQKETDLRATSSTANNPVKKKKLEQTQRESVKQYLVNDSSGMKPVSEPNRNRILQNDGVQDISIQIQICKERIRKLEEKNRYLKQVIADKLDIIVKGSTRQVRQMEKLVSTRAGSPLLEPFPDPSFTAKLSTPVSFHKTVFVLNPVETEEELQKLEDIIGSDPKYREQVIEYLQRDSTRTDLENRLHDAIDMLFCRRLFASMSWSGISRSGVPKIQLSKYENIIRLFQTVGTTENDKPCLRYIAEYLKTN